MKKIAFLLSIMCSLENFAQSDSVQIKSMLQKMMLRTISQGDLVNDNQKALNRQMFNKFSDDPLQLDIWYVARSPARKEVSKNISFDVNEVKHGIVVCIEEAQNTEGYQWQITDVAGSGLKLGKFNSNVETISTAELNSGIYMIRVVRDNEIVKVEKFTIIK